MLPVEQLLNISIVPKHPVFFLNDQRSK